MWPLSLSSQAVHDAEKPDVRSPLEDHALHLYTNSSIGAIGAYHIFEVNKGDKLTATVKARYTSTGSTYADNSISTTSIGRILSIMALLLSSASLFAQDKVTDTDTTLARLTILVTDFEDSTLSGERILFVSDSTGEIYHGISGSDGRISLSIPDGQIYTIQIKSVGDPETYKRTRLPKAEPGSRIEGEVKIKYKQKGIRLDHVYFGSNVAALQDRSYEELDELIEWLNLKPNLRIEIGGHTDHVGSDEANMTLSQGRADAVRDYLVSKGISPDRLIAKGYGETLPVASNTIEAGREKNRRTVISIIP